MERNEEADCTESIFCHACVGEIKKNENYFELNVSTFGPETTDTQILCKRGCLVDFYTDQAGVVHLYDRHKIYVTKKKNFGMFGF